ncbi:MAG: homoserine dehydrogenase [Syntrophomonadaceae bacterium]|nr:homoserine dehydrogenase [Syntrophomonadaceae bacterium]
MIKIALLGCGTVGGGVYKLLQQNQELIRQKAGQELRIVKVLEKDRSKCAALGLPDAMIAESYQEILNDDEISIVAELMGGIEPACTMVLEAMQHGKHVVTANKDMIAERGRELFDTAQQNGVDFYFEASVAGGIPIIQPMKQSLAGNAIQQVLGILNGTTNYILTKMTTEGSDFSEVLAEAQRLGYAESDPTADVGGLDAARKLAILASIAFNSRVTFGDVYVEGITTINARDIKYAGELGYVVKLLAIADENEGGVLARVYPALLPADHPLAAVNDVFNAVFVRGDAVGDIMHYGRGAGEMPTASSVVGDIIDIGRNLSHHSSARIGCTCFASKPFRPISELKTQYYIRLTVVDRPGVLAGIAGVFGDCNVSLQTVMQKSATAADAELMVITHNTREADLQQALSILKDKEFVHSIDNFIRLEGIAPRQ